MKKSVLAGIILCLFLVACQGFGGSKTVQEPQNFRFGTEGLSMSFMPNLPPPRVFENQPLTVMLRVENRGTFSLRPSDAQIYLTGFDNRIITGIPGNGKPVPPLEGRSQYVPQGGFDVVTFDSTISSLTGLRVDKYEPTLLATACYKYETHASGQICIDPSPFTPSRTAKVCVPGVVALGSQGAPIAVSAIGVEPNPGRTRFAITIQNVGGGDVFLQKDMAKCNPNSGGFSYTDIDTLELVDVSVSGTSVKQSCRPVSGNNVRLVNGQATIYCELPTQGQQAYVSAINVYLRYGYSQTASTRIEVRPTQ